MSCLNSVNIYVNNTLHFAPKLGFVHGITVPCHFKIGFINSLLPDFQVSESQADLFQATCSFGQDPYLGFSLLDISWYPISFRIHQNMDQILYLLGSVAFILTSISRRTQWFSFHSLTPFLIWILFRLSTSFESCPCSCWPVPAWSFQTDLSGTF